LHFWVELGILGIASFILLLAAYFARMRRTLAYVIPDEIRNPEKKEQEVEAGTGEFPLLLIGSLGAMVAILVHGLVDTPYFKNDLAFIFWFIYAIPFLIKTYTETSRGSQQNHLV
jgi:O-antigen ligase